MAVGLARWQTLLTRVPHYVWVSALLLALLATLHAVSVRKPVPGVISISEVTAAVPFRSEVMREQVRLPHILDDQSPMWWNRVDYDIPWPAQLHYDHPAEARLALLLPRVGTRFRVLLNDSEIYDVGWYVDSHRNILSGWFPYLVTLPSGLLKPNPLDNSLHIQIQGQLLERSGLWPLKIGQYDPLFDRYQELDMWQVTATWMMVITSVLMGVLALFLWGSLKEKLFLLMAIASLAHTFRLALSVMLETPFSFEWYFYIHRVSFTIYVGFFCLFIDELFGLREKVVRRLAHFLIFFGPLWLLLTLFSNNYSYYRMWAGTLALVAAFILIWLIVKARLRQSFTRDQLLVIVVAVFTLLTGIRDFFVIQLNFPGDADIRWMSIGSLALMFTLGWVLVQRATASTREVYRLNQSLAQIVAQREAELRAAFDQLRISEQQRAVEGERRRLMRDMHDGLGSQLVQTLNLVRSRQPSLDPQYVESMIQHALEELRMTLDSLEPMEGDLTTVLGTFRQRIAPALESAGIALVWEVEEVPALHALDSQGVMHLFRCMQEVFANILKHSKATRVVLRTSSSNDDVFLFVEDNGVGIPDMSRVLTKGRGLGNLRVRASSIGAKVRFFSTHPGTGVEFMFPIHTESRA